MLTEQAQVVAIEAEGVRVETVRLSGCSSCASKSVCGQKLLAEIGQGQRFEILSANPRGLSLRPGDRVVLGVEESSFIQASLMVYLLPLLGLAGAALLADMAGAVEALVIAAGVLGLLAGFVGVRSWSRNESQACRYRPQILNVVS